MIILDARFGKLDSVRSALGTAVAPVVWMGNAPGQFTDWMGSLFMSRDDLLEVNATLEARLLILERRALKYAALAQENNELRRRLNAAAALDDRVILAEVVGVSPDPFSHEVIINKGSRNGLSVGQAILDADGLMGQVRQTSSFTSRVLLISDSSHAVPVEVNRNGLRAVLLGNGKVNRLELVHVPDTADIREGDVLISSGLGGRFPRGYPVAEVVSIDKEPGEPFMTIEARPLAQLNRSQMVLVVFQPEDESDEAERAPEKSALENGEQR
ncbi:rod shape-determining protein MreC [Marinobacter sp.]|uniref:rod shape-determining protein MreC n=1 Tax=Marinobacter sp. TaxID=50741 RepID=UPI00384E4DB7